jgi:hypothetical protein
VNAHVLFWIAALAVFLTTVLGLLLYGRSLKEEEATAKKAVDQAIDQVREDMSFGNLFNLNRKVIDQYHIESRGRARWSFIASLGAMIIGLAIVSYAVYNTITATDTIDKVLATVVAAIGGTMSSYVTRTFMRAHDQALKQLDHHFRQPVVTGYFLTAERLAQALKEPEGQLRIYELIIDHTLKAALAELNSAKKKRPASSRHDKAEGPALK